MICYSRSFNEQMLMKCPLVSKNVPHLSLNLSILFLLVATLILFFYLGMYAIPKVSCYTYLGIPFNDSLSLKPVLALMHSKVNKSLYGCYPIL